MGQSSSTPRDYRHSVPQGLPRIFQPHSDRRGRDEDMDGRHALPQALDAGLMASEEPESRAPDETANASIATLPTWERPNEQVGPSASPSAMGSIPEEPAHDSARDDLDVRSPNFGEINDRRRSTMSRLGSRILPNSVIRGLLSSEEETPAEGQAHRHGIVSRTLPRSETGHSTSRFSPFGSIGARVARRRSIRVSHLAPSGDASTLPDLLPALHYLDTSAEPTASPGRGSWRRSARLSRVRDSLSAPISQMFGQPSSTTADQTTGATPYNQSAEHANGGPDASIPMPQDMDFDMDLDEPPHELDSVEPAMRSASELASTTTPQASPGPALIPRLPELFRAAQPPSAQREEQPGLSRILQLAASAIAAQVSNPNGSAPPNPQPAANDGINGSLETLIQSLHQVTSAQQNNATPSADGPHAPRSAPTLPVNFLRVFRFANTETSTRSGESSRPAGGTSDSGPPQPDGTDANNPSDATGGRTVTLVVVGVRFIPPNGRAPDEQPQQAGRGSDGWLGFPLFSRNNGARNVGGGDSAQPRTDERSRFAFGRPTTAASVGGAPDTLRPMGSLAGSIRQPTETGGPTVLPPLSSILSESPPGPIPPPSTPAEPGMSVVSSGTSTPSRRPSSASIMAPPVLPQLLEERSLLQPPIGTPDEGSSFSVPRQRRRSDSEYARHRDLGSGAARRNGVVEPDNTSPSSGRTWIIYVVGTNLAENHPAFATPSLFTDVSSYCSYFLSRGCADVRRRTRHTKI